MVWRGKLVKQGVRGQFVKQSVVNRGEGYGGGS